MDNQSGFSTWFVNPLRGANKRGQLMLFVSFAIVIVVVVISLFFFFGSKNLDELDSGYLTEKGFSSESENINDYIDYCVEYTAKNALILIAFQGGYYDAPSKHHASGPIFFPYYYYEGQINLPSLKFIEGELGAYVDDAIVNCIDESFTKHSLEFDDPETIVKISDDNVYFETDMTVTLESDVDTVRVDVEDYSIDLNSSLYDIYEVAEFFVESHGDDPEYYCINCIANMLDDRQLYGYLFPNVIEDGVTGFMIYENRTEIGLPYVYIFLNKYTGEEMSPFLYPGFENVEGVGFLV